MRVRVPRRGTGAEQPVVAEKSRNGEGAQGLSQFENTEHSLYQIIASGSEVY